MKKTALIVGISGQTGSYLARQLLRNGYRVLGTSRDVDVSNLWRLEKLGVISEVQVESMSPQDFRSVYTTLSSVRPDELYFLGGQSSVGLSFKQPFETFESIAVPVMNLLEAIRLLALDTRFLNSASSDMFGNQPGVILDEQSPMKPSSPYGVAKLASYWTTVQYREAFGIFASNTILSNHESPLRGSNFVTSRMVEQLNKVTSGASSVLEFGDVSVVRDWVWADDVAVALMKTLNTSVAGDFIVASGKSHSLLDLIRASGQIVGVDVDSVLTRNEQAIRPNEIQSITLNPGKIRETTGWEPQLTFEEIAQRLVEGQI